MIKNKRIYNLEKIYEGYTYFIYFNPNRLEDGNVIIDHLEDIGYANFECLNNNLSRYTWDYKTFIYPGNEKHIIGICIYPKHKRYRLYSKIDSILNRSVHNMFELNAFNNGNKINHSIFRFVMFEKVF